MPFSISCFRSFFRTKGTLGQPTLCISLITQSKSSFTHFRVTDLHFCFYLLDQLCNPNSPSVTIEDGSIRSDEAIEVGWANMIWCDPSYFNLITLIYLLLWLFRKTDRWDAVIHSKRVPYRGKIMSWLLLLPHLTDILVIKISVNKITVPKPVQSKTGESINIYYKYSHKEMRYDHYTAMVTCHFFCASRSSILLLASANFSL
jgi:hypothetical protein